MPPLVGGGNLRGDTPAHRLAADREPPRPRTDFAVAVGRDHATPCRLQAIVAIGHAPPGFGVGEVEGDGLDAPRRQRGGEFHHEGAVLAGPGAMAEDERDVGARHIGAGAA